MSKLDVGASTVSRRQLAVPPIKSARPRQRHAADLAPILEELTAASVKSLSAIADALNARNVRTPSGIGRWHAAQVARVLARLPA
jgi:hypothetical protein